MKKKNSIIAIGIVVGIGLIVFLASFAGGKFNKISKYKLLEAPVPINSIDVSIKISNEDNNKKAIITYANNSSYDISNIAIGIVVGIGLIVFLASFTSSKFNNISKYKLLEAPDSEN